jgi:hypothetical protein
LRTTSACARTEFLTIAAMVVLSIWLGQKGSPESKDPATQHSWNQ